MDFSTLMSRYAPPQIGAGVSALAKLAGSLQGCTQSNPMAGNDNIHNEGDQVCYTEGSTNIPITLLENVKPDQMTVMAIRPDGSRVLATTDYISDISNCMRGSR